MVALGFLCSGYYFFSVPLHTCLDNYALKITEERFGAGHVSSAHEEKINAIANAMGIHEPIIIRKMNHKSLCGFGYHNAFVYFPKYLHAIPLSNKPFLYLSEGFFEDISPDEQLFLIGHELIHAKHKHLLWSVLIILLAVLVIFVLVYLLVKPWVNSFFVWYGGGSYNRFLKFAFYTALFFGIDFASDFFYVSYKRSIEWQADRESLALLKSYNGGIKFFERSVREYRQDWHNGGIFVDHPSNYERRMYCLTAQQNESLNKSIG